MAKSENENVYFPHYINARNDRKVRRLRKELGVEGYGIFYMLLEVLREQSDLRYPMEDIDLLAEDFGTSEPKVKVVICNYGLFNIDKNDFFFSPKQIEYLKPYFAKSKRAKHAALLRWGKLDTELDANAMQMHSKSNANAMQAKKSKAKQSKEEDVSPPPTSILDTIKSDMEYLSESDMIKDLHQQDPNIVKKIIHDTMVSLGYGKAESLWYYEDKLIPAKFSVFKKGQANVIKLITDIVDLHNREQIFIKRTA
jgi:hypothetical protein